ncbi:hypothetical protein [Mumia sp. Pv 4-285]|uniref:hypothetical protein n=1 Tax=Mumia qirimensis TaxID=3234852 RepID=UPI00351D2036
MIPRRTLSVLAVAGMLVLAGCAEDPVVDASTPISITVTIADGTITPLGLEYDASTGQPVVVDVTSDTDDELHLHAEPEKTFAVTPGTHQFQFTVDVPGSVSLESHHVGGTIATIDVRP